MLATPKHGWSQITIGNWTDRCSYLNDVPTLLLEALELTCRTHRPAAVAFDAEGWEYTIVFDDFATHVISDNCDEGYIYSSVEVKPADLAKELIADIRRDIDGWADWAFEPSDDEVGERKKDLLVYCDILEKRIK